MNTQIQINANDPKIRITRAIANIKNKYIIGNSNTQEIKQWQEVIHKLSSLLDKEEKHPSKDPTISFGNFEDPVIDDPVEIDFSEIKSKYFIDLNVYPNFNIYFKPTKPKNKHFSVSITSI
ncbi:hypothetical protein [Tenacibaculum sp. 190524A05c]|uniref:hypothetical protein n=1 Tax=Tenacibaculum platacis TaxID=3137852 RepID=UPI0032B1558C